jgi:hypothetical protein
MARAQARLGPSVEPSLIGGALSPPQLFQLVCVGGERDSLCVGGRGDSVPRSRAGRKAVVVGFFVKGRPLTTPIYVVQRACLGNLLDARVVLSDAGRAKRRAVE